MPVPYTTGGKQQNLILPPREGVAIRLNTPIKGWCWQTTWLQPPCGAVALGMVLVNNLVTAPLWGCNTGDGAGKQHGFGPLVGP